MILLDTNVLIYGFDATSPHHPWAREIIRDSLLGDGAAINPVILAEYLVGDAAPETVLSRLQNLGVTLLDLPSAASLLCANAYALYLANRRLQPVSPAPKIPLPDFFIGAHASLLGMTLATADADRYHTYFPEIKLLTPPEPVPT